MKTVTINIYYKKLRKATMKLIYNYVASGKTPQTNNIAFEMMEEYGRYKFMLDNKELFDENNIEKVFVIYGQGSVLETVKEIGDYHLYDSVKSKSDSVGYAKHFLMQSFTEIFANDYIKSICNGYGISLPMDYDKFKELTKLI